MAKESPMEKLKDTIEADIEQYEKSLETSTCPVGEFVAQGDEDAEVKADSVNVELGKDLHDRLEAAAKKVAVTPEELAKKAIAQYLDSIEKGGKSK